MSRNNKVTMHECVIPINTAVSNSKHLPNDRSIVGVYMPDAWTAADLGIDVSEDNVTWVALSAATGAAAIALDVAASLYLPIDPTLTMGANYYRLTSKNTSGGAALNQAAARTLRVAVRYVE